MGATTTRVCGESKRCITPCKCRRCTTDTKKRATSGCRNSSALTHKTSLTRSSWTLPTKSTRGVNERGRGLPAPGGHPPAFALTSRSKTAERMQAGNGSSGNVWDSWESFLNPAQNNLLDVDTILNIFFTLDVRSAVIGSKAFPSKSKYRKF